MFLSFSPCRSVIFPAVQVSGLTRPQWADIIRMIIKMWVRLSFCRTLFMQRSPEMTIEQILKMRQEASGLNKLMHMRVITLDKDGGATVELDLTEELLNPLGLAHGGTIFTLCDIAAGSAAASHGLVAVTLDSNIHYYRPGRLGKTLTAVAYERKRGKKTAVYMVEVHDDEHKHIADAVFTMFYTGQTLDDMQH